MSFDLGGMLSQLLSPEIQNAGTDSGASIAADSKAAEKADGTSLPGFSVGDFVNGILQHLAGSGKQDATSKRSQSQMDSAAQTAATAGITDGAQKAMAAANAARVAGGSGGSGGLNPADLISSITSLFGIK